jgi:hypothetical protein
MKCYRARVKTALLVPRANAGKEVPYRRVQDHMRMLVIHMRILVTSLII